MFQNKAATETKIIPTQINEVTDAILTDQTIGELSELMQEEHAYIETEE